MEWGKLIQQIVSIGVGRAMPNTVSENVINNNGVIMYLIRILALIIALTTVGCYTKERSEIISKGLQRQREGDGGVDTRVDRLYRGDQAVMLILKKRDAQGNFVVRSRSYLINGNIVATESDEDGDGFFEMFSVYGSRTEDMDSFIRKRDGSIKPVSAEALAGLKKQHAALAEFGDNTLYKGEDSEKAMELLSAAQQKIQAAKKENR
ncbi:MAG: hypothetical protein ACR2NX_06150 [Chthoniobacterales bacterium]